MDVATGPCVAIAGRKHALVSVHQQEGPETPGQTAALYRVLTGRRDDDVLHAVEHRGQGSLYVCSPGFLNAMVDANDLLCRLADDDRANRDRHLTSFAAQRAAWSEAWMAAVDWPREMVSTLNRLGRIGKARIAKEKGQELYCWYGLAVPEHVVVSGSGP